MSEKTGKVHEIVADQILVNKAFREGIQEYWAKFGIEVVLPTESMMKPLVPALPKAAKAWEEGTFRILGVDETICANDQWAPLSSPDRWKTVADSVGKSTSLYKSSRFRRLTIEVDAADLPPSQDSGANLCEVECYLWNDGDRRVRMTDFVSEFDNVRNKYGIRGSFYDHARPTSMGEPQLIPIHPFRDAGAALIRCECRLWNDSSRSFDPAGGVLGMVASFNGELYTARDGRNYYHAQPSGATIVTIPPVTLPPHYGEIFGHTGEAVIRQRCWVWNDHVGARPNGIENAILTEIVAYEHGMEFCYRTGTNGHQYARPEQFGHPSLAALHDGSYHVVTPDGKVAYAMSTEGDVSLLSDGSQVSGCKVIKMLTGVDLVGKRCWAWHGARSAARSYLIEDYKDGVYFARSQDSHGGCFISFPYASLDLVNQCPRQNSGTGLIGEMCFVWNERFSEDRKAVILNYNSAEGYHVRIGDRLQKLPNARPVALGVPQ